MERNKSLIAIATLFLALGSFSYAVERTTDSAEDGGGRQSDWNVNNENGGNTALQYPEMSKKQTLACKVAMCVSNPGGPNEFSECVDVMREKKRYERRGRKVGACKFL